MIAYQDIRREFCNLMKWHPVFGEYEKPINLSFTDFIHNQKIFGTDWASWEIFDSAIPSQDEMIFDLEFIYGNLHYLPSKAIRLDEPVLRVAKSKTKMAITLWFVSITFRPAIHLIKGLQETKQNKHLQ